MACLHADHRTVNDPQGAEEKESKREVVGSVDYRRIVGGGSKGRALQTWNLNGAIILSIGGSIQISAKAESSEIEKTWQKRRKRSGRKPCYAPEKISSRMQPSARS
jgi:hypothetical protein